MPVKTKKTVKKTVKKQASNVKKAVKKTVKKAPKAAEPEIIVDPSQLPPELQPLPPEAFKKRSEFVKTPNGITVWNPLTPGVKL